MNERKHCQRAHWEKMRSGGKVRYVIYQGVLGWGLFMAIAMTVYALVARTAEPWLSIAANFVVYPLAGGLWGLWMWSSSERYYRQESEQFGLEVQPIPPADSVHSQASSVETAERRSDPTRET